MVRKAKYLKNTTTVRVVVGSDGFVHKINENVGNQLIDALGADRVKYTLLEGETHHFYAAKSFVDMLSRISLRDLNDEVQMAEAN